MTSAQVTHGEWSTARGKLSLEKPVIFGILNITPDSFSDGGLHTSVGAAVARALQMVDEGAAVIDVGGESTRPGATPVSATDEIARVIPVIEALSRQSDVLISIDTSKSEVAARALDAGASIINDVSAFRIDPATADVAARTGAGVILMHSRGGVTDMASYTHANYGAAPEDVVDVVRHALCDVVSSANATGISRDAIALDPGLGFSKRTAHSIALLAHLDRIVHLGFPVLAGPSRKRFVADVAGDVPLEDRLDGTIAACVVALMKGARMFRVHDVGNVRRALALAEAVMRVDGARS
jgi:dihydropteroate synthase